MKSKTRRWPTTNTQTKTDNWNEESFWKNFLKLFCNKIIYAYSANIYIVAIYKDRPMNMDSLDFIELEMKTLENQMKAFLGKCSDPNHNISSLRILNCNTVML